jgi:hypothetical protein
MSALVQQGVVLVLVLGAFLYVGRRAWRAIRGARVTAGSGTGDAGCGSGCGCSAAEGPRRAPARR